MRVTTAFNRVLALPGAVVESVSFEGDSVIAGIHQTRRRHRCPCGWPTWARYDVRRRRWRHLDLAGRELWLEADIARIDCRACGRVRTEDVPWARPGAKCSRDVEDTIAWLAQRMDKSAIAALMRVAWRTVDATVRRLVGEYLDADVNTTRLDGLVRIGIDEISYKRGHHYLTVVADHDTGRVVWVAKDRTQESIEDFVEALGPDRAAQIEAVTMDMSPIYRGVTERELPQAQICFDPFHVIKWANEALGHVLDAVRPRLSPGLNSALAPAPPPPAQAAPQRLAGGRTSPARVKAQNKSAKHNTSRKVWRTARFLIRSGAERLAPHQQVLLDQLRAEDLQLARAWELKEGLRGLYQQFDTTSPAGAARRYLQAWCQAAETSGIPAFYTLTTRIRRAFDGIIAAIELGLSNSRLEGINAKIRVIQRRGYGHPRHDTLAAMIYLCLGEIRINLPTKTS